MKLIIFLISLSILFSISFELQSHQNFIPNLSWTSTQSNSKPETQFIRGKNDLLMEMHSIDSRSSSSSSSPASILRQRLERDATRTKSLSRKKDGFNATVYSGLPQGSGEYYTHIGFGSPAQLKQVILDIGSDDIWVQCKPCEKCYAQPDPLFDPTISNSSSYVHCGSKRCPTTSSCPAAEEGKRCSYDVDYGDGSKSSGDYMTETLTFRGSHVKKILFGCGHRNTGDFAGADGLLGLGRGETSFVSQAGRRLSYKFSYCLVARDSTDKSYILFGPTALSRTAVYTPMLRNPDPDLASFYYVALEGISVGGKLVRIPKGVFDMDGRGGGGVIIDSGTSVTRLARPAYEAVRDAFLDGTRYLKRTSGYSILDTCYDLSDEMSVTVPTVVLHFKGVDMNLPARNYIVPLDKNGTFCFAFSGMTVGLSIIGNIQQQGFRLSFDLKREQVGFTPGSCGPDAN